MRVFGAILAVVGVIWGIIAFTMGTSVETPEQRMYSSEGSFVVPSMKVHNLDRADRRRTHLMIAGSALVIGTLLFGFGALRSGAAASTANDVRKCPFCAEQVKREAIVCKHCGKELPPVETAPVAVSLHEAVWEGSWAKVNQLLQQGADINQVNEDGKTPLELARERGDHVIANFLLSQGAAERKG